MNPQPPQYPSGYPQPPRPPKKATSPWVWLGLIALVLALLLGACVGLGSVVSDSNEEAESTVATIGAAPPSSTSAYCASPTPGDIADELASVLAVGDRFGGAAIRAAQLVAASKDRSKFDLIVSLCGSEIRGYQLKIAASDIARKVKASPFEERIADMQVNNMQRPWEDAERSVQADFAINTFTGVAGTSEAAWKTRSER